MTELLKNHVAGEWVAGAGEGVTLSDPVTGEALVRVSSEGLDLAHAFRFARDEAGAALRALTYAQRAARLAEIVKLLQAKRDDYYAIAIANSARRATIRRSISTEAFSRCRITRSSARRSATCMRCATATQAR